MYTDDLPWPELGNVSRGATRGNQGAKGTIGPPDPDGRALLQLRVQPGVLAVKLNRKSTDWYRRLDAEVQAALKETKTYWRKARRRQDYDARADQDHMELHEWLQQLKDKVMSHLELLMQKGDILGPPYVMPDHIEFTFMRGFVERQAAGTPHNPRLRNTPRDQMHRIAPEDLVESDTNDAGASAAGSEPGPSNWASSSRSPVNTFSPIRTTIVPTHTPADPSPSLAHGDVGTIARKIESANNALRQARDRLAAARQSSEDALRRYQDLVEAEKIAMADVAAIEEQIDELVQHMVHRAGGPSNPAARAHPSPSSPSENALGLARGYGHTHDPAHAHAQYAPAAWGSEAAMMGGAGVNGGSGAGTGTGGPGHGRHVVGGAPPSSSGMSLRGATHVQSPTGWAEPMANGLQQHQGGTVYGESSALRPMSPVRKHPRDWERQQQHLHNRAHAGAYGHKPEDGPPHPPRKRLSSHTDSASPALGPTQSPTPTPGMPSITGAFTMPHPARSGQWHGGHAHGQSAHGGAAPPASGSHA